MLNNNAYYTQLNVNVFMCYNILCNKTSGIICSLNIYTDVDSCIIYDNTWTSPLCGGGGQFQTATALD